VPKPQICASLKAARAIHQRCSEAYPGLAWARYIGIGGDHGFAGLGLPCILLLGVLGITTSVAEEPKVGKLGLPFVPADVLEAQRGPFEIRNSAVDRNTPDLDDFLVVNALCGPKAIWQEVEQYDGTLGPTQGFVKARQPSTGQIQWRSDLPSIFTGSGDDPGSVNGRRWCTGTLITEDRLITAGHCFLKNLNGWITPRRNHESLPPDELAKLMVVNFNYQISAQSGNVRETTTFPIVQLLEFAFEKSASMDYAIIQMGRDASGRLPGQGFEIAELDTSDTAASLGDTLTIIQHPNGETKKVAAGPLASASGNYLFYKNLDTLGGSSGIPIGLAPAERGRTIGMVSSPRPAAALEGARPQPALR